VERGKGGKEKGEREEDLRPLRVPTIPFLPSHPPFKLLLLVLYNAITNQPINQSKGSITSPRYSNNNMILASFESSFFFPLQTLRKLRAHAYVRIIPLPIVPPFKATVSHRSGHNTVHQPTQPTNHYAIISLARRRTTLPTFPPARNALFLLEKGKSKTLIGDQQQPRSSGT